MSKREQMDDDDDDDDEEEEEEDDLSKQISFCRVLGLLQPHAFNLKMKQDEEEAQTVEIKGMRVKGGEQGRGGE